MNPVSYSTTVAAGPVATRAATAEPLLTVAVLPDADGTCTLRLTGCLAAGGCAHLADCLDALMGANPARILIDMSRLRFLHHVAAQLLAETLAGQHRRTGATARIVGAEGVVRAACRAAGIFCI